MSAEPAVLRAHLGPGGGDSDGTLAIVLAEGAQASAAARRVAEALAADTTLRPGWSAGWTWRCSRRTLRLRPASPCSPADREPGPRGPGT